MYGKKIICGMKAMKHQVYFHMKTKVDRYDATATKKEYQEFKGKDNTYIDDTFGSVEEFCRWMVEMCSKLEEDDGARAKIRTFGCYISAGKVHGLGKLVTLVYIGGSVRNKKCNTVGWRDGNNAPDTHAWPVLIQLDCGNPDLSAATVALVQTNDADAYKVQEDGYAFLNDPPPVQFCEVRSYLTTCH